MTANRGPRRPGRPDPHVRGRRPPTPVRDTLDTLAATMGMGDIDAVNRLFVAWADIVGEDLADKCRPLRIDAGVLAVEAVDSQWAGELSWMTDLIKSRCRDALGAETVSEVRITAPRV